MQIGYTYALADDSTASLYLEPGVTPPPAIPVMRLGQVEEARRVSDRDLECGPVPSVDKMTGRGCTTHECHRRELGKCQCGRHPGDIPFRRAAAPTTDRETL